MQPKAGRQAVDHLFDAPLARLDNADGMRLMSGDSSRDLSCETAAIVYIVKADIVDGPASFARFLSEVAHR